MKLASLIQTELPYVIYKKPKSAKLKIIQQNDTNLYIDKTFQSNGFYFAPYDFKTHPTIVFPENKIIKQSFFTRLFHTDKNDKILLNKIETNIEEASKHQNKIKKALEYIQKGNIQKIIISRKQEIKYQEFNIFQSLLKLIKNYEHSFVYLWHHPQIGTWMGATPEVLVKYQNNYLQTMALAGTLPVQYDQPISWQIKEINEQQIVTDYIKEKLSFFSTKIKTSKPTTIFQGNLAHIKTNISTYIQKSQFNKILLSLHPTPAVCGLPQKEAQKIIKKIEQYDRKYYTGFLGYKNKNISFFYVNLRSMEILPKKLLIYVGGGITIDSQIEKEWEETIEKSKVILSPFLNNHK